jgi:NADPH-dependent curcumin reductase
MDEVIGLLGRWLAEGRLHYRQTIVDGLERAPDAFVRMLAGETVGKTLVRIDPDAASA